MKITKILWRVTVDRLEFGKCNMRLKTYIKPKEATFHVATVSVHRSSIRFIINKNKVFLDVEIFREILQTCPKIPRQEFEDLPLEHDILSFVRDLRHTRDITYLADMNVDYLYQPWRAFSTFINKCLSGKETGMDKICLSCVQILWDAKKTNKLSYPRFTKIIIDYFISKDQSISRRNKMFWHTVREDTMYTSMRCISRNEKTQVYDTILLKELTDQAMLESQAYQTYYTFASREKNPKPKNVQKKADSNTSHKQKPVQATKGTRIKTKAKVAKSDKKKQPAKKPKAKGLTVLPKVALTKAKQLRLATERRKQDFHISHASGSGVPDVPIYDSESDKVSWGDSNEEDDGENDFEDDVNNDDDSSEDHDDESGDEMRESDRDEILDPNQTNIDQTEHEEEDVDERELYDDVNVNLGNDDTEIINVDQGALEQLNASHQSGFKQEEEDAHVTLTLVLDTRNTGAYDAITIPKITSSFTTPTPLPRPFVNPLSQQATPTLTPMALETTTSLPALPNFMHVFKFNERVTNLEKDLSKIKQVDQYAQALSFISAIVDRYIDNKLGEAINKAIQAHNFNSRKEAQVEKMEYIELVDSTLRTINKEESSYEAAATLSEFELTKILIDKIEKNESFDVANHKRELYDALIKSYNTYKDIFESNGEVFYLKRSRDESDKDQDPFRWVRPRDVKKKVKRIIAVYMLKIIKKYDYSHLEEIEVHRDDHSNIRLKKVISKDFTYKILRTCYFYLFNKGWPISKSTNGYRQAALSKKIDAESIEVHWWKGIRE
nr:hypothetical protein [Tanacetum cinerariifolium]